MIFFSCFFQNLHHLGQTLCVCFFCEGDEWWQERKEKGVKRNKSTMANDGQKCRHRQLVTTSIYCTNSKEMKIILSSANSVLYAL
jgi:hypothetical protein